MLQQRFGTQFGIVAPGHDGAGRALICIWAGASSASGQVTYMLNPASGRLGYAAYVTSPQVTYAA